MGLQRALETFEMLVKCRRGPVIGGKIHFAAGFVTVGPASFDVIRFLRGGGGDQVSMDHRGSVVLVDNDVCSGMKPKGMPLPLAFKPAGTKHSGWLGERLNEGVHQPYLSQNR